MRNHRSSEAGSAYVITLLALVVLTILALSLALVTQTEVQVGANEKTVNRTFYAADSGLHVWLADLLVSQKNPPSRTVILNKVSVGAGSALSTNVADRVTVSVGALVNKYPCNWCPSAENSNQQYFHEDFTVSSTAQRIAWSGSGAPPPDATVLGQKTLTSTFRMEPMSQDTCQDGQANQNGACGSGNN
jgi:Tfp pilus assembly protein PilX